jgi:hypothetical protein
MKKIIFFLLSLALLSACKQKIDEFKADKGSADFTKYIAVGNSLFAGYADGALYHTGQVNSIPNLISGQLQYVGSGAFVQPMVTSEFGVNYPGSTPKLVLGFPQACNGEISLGPVLSSGAMDALAPVGYDVNNFAVPGAKSFHILAPHYGDFSLLSLHLSNPYFCRFSKTPASTVLGDAMAANASFFSVWLGDNDVLSYALSGGADTITSPAFFQTVMGGVLQGLTSNGAKGVVSTIPDVTAIPFFTTIPYNGLVLTRQSLVDSINHFMSTLFQVPVTYHLGQNAFLIYDSTATNYFKVRQMQPGELVLLTVPQDSLKCGGWGIISSWKHVPMPIPKQFILNLNDVTKLKTATAAYNEIIKGLAALDNLAVVNMNAKLTELEKGIIWDGIKLNTTFVSGGVFSLDGIHLTPRGCAITANYFIEAINSKYGSTIPLVDPTKYQAVIFP